MNKCSIIVPVLNEALILPSLFKNIENLPAQEVLFVDGGSRDQTLFLLKGWSENAEAQAPKMLLSSPRGRAKQMNAGAKKARGQVLIFLHSDSKLPSGGLENIIVALKKTSIVGGAFRLKIDSPRLFLRFISWMANLRSSFLKLPYGDQGYFVRKEVFDKMGGYRDIGLMEDVDFFRRLKKEGEVILLDKEILSSARRWKKEGYFLNSLKNITFLALYFLKVSPEWLKKQYYS